MTPALASAPDPSAAPPAELDPGQAHVICEWPYDRPLVACRFDPLGRFVCTGSEDATVQRFALEGGTRTVLSGGHDTWVCALAYSNDGGSLVTGGCDGRLTWWETAAEAPQPVRSLEAHQGWIRALSVSPDGHTLVSAGNDLIVRLWNISDGTLIRELRGHEKHIYSVAFTPQGDALLTGDLAGVIRQWDPGSGAEVRTFDAKPLYSYNDGQQVDFGGVRALAVSPDGLRLAAGGLHKATNPLGAVHEPLVLLFDWQSQKLERQLLTEGITGGVVWRLAWLADGSLMGVSGGSSGGFLLFWKTDADKDAHRFKLPNIARDMDLYANGLIVATAHHDQKVRITRLAADSPPPTPIPSA
jgi:WD40 repeat protein